MVLVGLEHQIVNRGHTCKLMNLRSGILASISRRAMPF